MKNKLSFLKYFYIILLICSHKLTFGAAYLEADNNKPNIDTVFRIIVTSTDPNISASYTPDLNQIKENFEILNQSQQTSQYIINGQRESKVKWVLTVIPKKSGNIKINSIQIGNEYTNPLSFNITNKQSKNSGVKKFDISVSIDNNTSHYLNSAIPVTVKALIFKDQQIDNLNLHTPEQTDLNLIKLDDFKTERYIDNKPYIVYTLKYLMFAQKSGKLLLPSFRLSGNELIPENTGDDLFGFQRYYKRPFNVTSNTPEIEIKKIPSIWKNSNWLSANSVRISEEYSPKNSTTLKQGDALTRTITITAINADNTALPSEIIKKSTSDNYKMYIDSPEYKQTIKNNKIYSTFTQTVTYIFNNAGKAHIPEINIPWWNLNNNKIENIKIDSKNINIEQVAGFTDNNQNSGQDNLATQQNTLTKKTFKDKQVYKPKPKKDINATFKEDLTPNDTKNTNLENHVIPKNKTLTKNFKWYEVNSFINHNITNNKLLIIFYLLILLVVILLFISIVLYYLYKKQKNFITYIKARKYGINISAEYKQKIKDNLINLKTIEENLSMSCQNEMPHDIYHNISLIAEYFNITVNKIIRTADSEFKELLQNLQEMLFANNSNNDIKIDGILFWKLYKEYKKHNLVKSNKVNKVNKVNKNDSNELKWL